jgi:hypothetical protein
MCKTQDFASTKADYVAQAYVAALAQGLRANIWYSLIGWRGSALTDRKLQPLLAYQAYRFAAEQLGKAVYEGKIAEYPNLIGFRFNRVGDRLWVLWALDDETHELRLPDMPSAIYDSLGSPQPVAQDLMITHAPIYVQWQP